MNSTKELKELKEILCDSLAEYGRARDLSSSKLQTIDTLAHACKNVCKIIESCEEEEYSKAMDRSYRNSYEGGNSGRNYYADGGSYEGGMSGRRGRAANGRFVSRDSGDMVHQMRDLMNNAPDEQTRRDMQRIIDKMENM